MSSRSIYDPPDPRDFRLAAYYRCRPQAEAAENWLRGNGYRQSVTCDLVGDEWLVASGAYRTQSTMQTWRSAWFHISRAGQPLLYADWRQDHERGWNDLRDDPSAASIAAVPQNTAVEDWPWASLELGYDLCKASSSKLEAPLPFTVGRRQFYDSLLSPLLQSSRGPLLTVLAYLFDEQLGWRVPVDVAGAVTKLLVGGELRGGGFELRRLFPPAAGYAAEEFPALTSPADRPAVNAAAAVGNAKAVAAAPAAAAEAKQTAPAPAPTPAHPATAEPKPLAQPPPPLLTQPEPGKPAPQRRVAPLASNPGFELLVEALGMKPGASAAAGGGGGAAASAKSS